MIDCELTVWSQGPHVQQIYTGLGELARAGLIKFRQRFAPMPAPDPHAPRYLSGTRATHCALVVEGSHRLYFDLHDSAHIDLEALNLSDWYFKRSYDPIAIGGLPESARIQPLGFNYEVYADGFDTYSIARASAAGRRWRATAREAAAGLIGRVEKPTIGLTSKVPQFDLAPKVLFLARAWDPEGSDICTTIEADERRSINDMRAQCILALREAFGERFIGGLARTDYAVRHYPQALVPEGFSTQQRHYLRLLGDCPICIATQGLHRSNGWKLGEYVAHAKAIVSERPHFAVPGDFSEGLNFLRFDDADSCVRAVDQLMQDKLLRIRMMINNHRYYQAFLRPDQLVLNSILRGLSSTFA